jgi:hypothetical protein
MKGDIERSDVEGNLIGCDDSVVVIGGDIHIQGCAGVGNSDIHGAGAIWDVRPNRQLERPVGRASNIEVRHGDSNAGSG